MTIVGVLGIAATLGWIAFAWDRLTTTRLLLSLLLAVIHIGASVYYWQYSLVTIADSYAYYFYPWVWQTPGFALSTTLVAETVQTLKMDFGATYLDCFLVFQSLGFAGIMILARMFNEIESMVGVVNRRGFIGVLFLPSVNFWPSAIGKDAPLFFAISLVAWAMLKIKRRYVALAIGMAVMVLFRAHIALIAAASMAGASLMGGGVSTGRKIGLFLLAGVGLLIAMGAVQDSFGVDVTSSDSVSNFFERQNTVSSTVAGTTSIGSASFPLKAVSLLFRPLFFDAKGLMGIIASFENILVIIAFIYVIARWRDLMLLARRVFFIRFCLIFAFFLLLSLTLVYYNVGLGLRQRVMAYPMIFCILVALKSMAARASMVESRPPAPTTGPPSATAVAGE